MNDASDFRQLFRHSLAALLLGAGLVALCYWFVDRPVAFYVYNEGLSHYPVLVWLTYPPPIIQAVAPAALAALMVRRAWGPFQRWHLALLAACVAIILADQFRESLLYVFGRYWPETWIDNNPSLIRDGAYGFHPFHGGSAYGSFPSGHTARTTAFLAPFWIAWPRWRWVCVVLTAAVAAGLIGMNYHFVGDVVAGGILGGIVGAYTAQCSGTGTVRE